MSLACVEHVFNGTTTLTYDSTKTFLGPEMLQVSGSGEHDDCVGPRANGFARIAGTWGFGAYLMDGYAFSSTIHHIFLLENVTTGATRRVLMLEHNLQTNAFIFKGGITFTFQNGATMTNRSFDVARALYTTGQASVADTAVTGSSGANWTGARIAAGARIGFGSTDPTAITQWYTINTIGSGTSITIDRTAGTIAEGPYVIEELRLVYVGTHSTPTSGGLFLVKGLSPSAFTGAVAGSWATVATATNTDNIRATYWLADESTVTNIISYGTVVLPKVSDTEHEVLIQNGLYVLQFYRFNLRASLTLDGAGKSTSAFVHRSGAVGVAAVGAMEGTVYTVSCASLATLQSGRGSGELSVFVSTTSKLIRCPVSKILAGSTSFAADGMVENPTGGGATYRRSTTWRLTAYIESIDMFFTAQAAGYRCYVTKYYSYTNPLDYPLICQLLKYEHPTWGDKAGKPLSASSAFLPVCIGKILYLSRISNSVGAGNLFAVSITTDWNLASTTNSRVITPSLDTKGCVRLNKVYTNNVRFLGEQEGIERTESFRTYARTSGITDNSGTWTLLDSTGDISSLTPSNEIQIMYEFKIYGHFVIPARILSSVVTYQDCVNDEHYRLSTSESDPSQGILCWLFARPFSSTVPELKVYVLDADAGGVLLSASTVTDSADFDKSTNGGSSWGAYDTTDRANSTTYIRFTTDYNFRGKKINPVLVLA